MSSFILKIIAIIAMTFDHLSYSIYGNVSWMNYIGRLALPIFSWQIATGVSKTTNLEKYLFRLSVTALIAQPFFMLYFPSNNQIYINTIFTLLFGAISISVFKKNEKIGLGMIALACFCAERFNFDYGAYGILTIYILYLFKDNKWLMLIMQIIYNVIYYLIFKSKIQLFCIISYIIIMCYNGKKGKDIKYLFYIFYPLHFLILYILRRLFFE